VNIKNNYPLGIVETEYVKTQKEKAKEILTKNRLVALLGETGTGKTCLARKMAQEMTGDYEFVPGHRFITAEDLFYYRGLDVRKIDPNKVPEIIKEEIEKFRKEHPDLSEEEIRKYEEIITDVVKGQAASKELTTEVFLSAVLRAAKEGKIVIVDEFNYIPPALLGGLNVLIEAKPGQEISVFGQKIKVKSGFGVIFTGNITRSEFQGRYLQREKIDPALVNRLNSGLIEYGSLPQANNVAFQESILSEKEFKEGKEIPKRELFEIGLTILADEKGNISGPKNLLEKTWNLASEISLLQKLYAGEKLETPVKLASGQDVVLKEYAISNRTFRSILEAWKNDNFRYSIDWYLYDNLIRPASVISPSEAGQIFLLLKERGLFFQDKSWEVLKVDPLTYRIEGIEEIERNRKKFLETQRLKGPIHYFTPKEVAEALLGIKMPELEEIERVKKEKIDKEKMEKYVELKEKYEKLKAFIENLGETVELYCQDEANILGEG
jgi:MoxR-like ATPase/DNA-binding HxlR family transcriptional regulator